MRFIGLMAGKLMVACALMAPAAAQEPAAEAGTTAAEASEQARERAALEPRVSAADLAGGSSNGGRPGAGQRVVDELDLDRTEITGNQELPKVLYIVPWQKADPGDLVGRPVNSLLEEVLAPVDREEFIRQIDYYGDLYGVTREEE